MKKRIHISESLYLDFELTAIQAVVLLAMFIVMFVIPVYAYGELSAPPAAQTEGQVAGVQATLPPGSETYTENALAQDTGNVAGISTDTTAPDSTYITIPVINLEFDTSLNDPDSVPILAGGILGAISISLFVYLFFDTLFRR